MSDYAEFEDFIALREDVPEHGLARNRVGEIVKIIKLQEFEVEFRDDNYRIVASIPLKREQVQILRFETTLDDRVFWQLIEAAKARSDGDAEREVQLLIDVLAERSIADIYSFGWLYGKYHWFAYRKDLWAAAYIIESGCSDDAFEDFRSWLIGQGEKVYYDALRDPETLLDLIEVRCLGGWAYGDVPVGIGNVHYDAYEKKTGEEMQLAPGNPARPKLIGALWDDESASQMYPKLAAKFGIGECDDEST